MKTGVLLISHGSRTQSAYDEVVELKHKLQKSLVNIPIEIAFLEINEPSILKAIDVLVAQEIFHIKILLNFLNSGRHVTEHIPQIIKESCRKHPQLKIERFPHIGAHNKFYELFIDVLQANGELFENPKS